MCAQCPPSNDAPHETALPVELGATGDMSRPQRPFWYFANEKMRPGEMIAEPGDTQINEDTHYPDRPVKLKAWCNSNSPA